MREIGIRQLKERASEVIRQVREGNEAITVTYRGRPVARIVPVSEIDRSRAATSAVWAEMDELAEEVAGRWPSGLSAAEAVEQERREL